MKAVKCPKCGSTDYSEQTIGWWPVDGHKHDPNRKECVQCGHFWWESCPACGKTKEVTG
jgi:predicted nucleic-acid-binding Zn-ribbon protein